MPEIVSVSLEPVAALDVEIAPEKIVSGAPKTGLASAYENEATGFYAGTWESSVGAWRVSYDEDELCVILAGRVRLSGDDGRVVEYGPGEAFVIPRGFAGVWETLEPLRKIYAIAT